MEGTFYDLLEVSQGASQRVVTAAYDALRQELEARDANDPRIAELDRAWEVLGDPGRRAAYDTQLSASGGITLSSVPDEEVIGQAIAQGHTSILLRPGRYRESLVLDKAVELIGDGAAADIVLESDGPCVLVEVGRVVIRGITLSGWGAAGRDDGAYNGAARVHGGELALEDCDISAGDGPAVAAFGEASAVTVRRCHVRGGAGHIVVAFGEGAAGVVEESDIDGGFNTDVLVWASRQAAVTIRDCRMHSACGYAVVALGSEVAVEGCEIEGLRFERYVMESFEDVAAVYAFGEEAAVTLDRCSLRDITSTPDLVSSGVALFGGASARLTDCTLAVTVQYGLHAGDESRLDVSGGSISGPSGGIWFGPRSSGTVEDCEISQCEIAGIAVTHRAAPLVRSSTVRDCGNGIGCKKKGAGRFEALLVQDCTIGVGVMKRANPLFTDCEIAGGIHGVVATDAGAGTFQRCAIHSARSTGCYLDSGATTVFSDCLIRQNGGLGVEAGKTSAGRVTDCNLTGNGDGPIVVTRGSTTVTSGNRVDGVTVTETGSGYTATTAAGRDPYLPGLEHEDNYENVYFAGLETMADLVGRFARRHLTRWRLLDEEVTPDGTAITVAYAVSEVRTWEVRSGTVAGRMARSSRAGGAGRAITAIPYELETEITLRAAGPRRTELTMRTRERIDPARQVTQFPLGRHYLAPSALYTEGFPGRELDPFLTRALRPG